MTENITIVSNKIREIHHFLFIFPTMRGNNSTASTAWRSKKSERRVPSHLEFEKILGDVLAYAEGRELAADVRAVHAERSSALRTFLRAKNLRFDDGHGRYAYWLDTEGTKSYASTYQLARRLVQGLPNTQRDWSTSQSAGAPTRRRRRTTVAMGDVDEDEENDIATSFLPPSDMPSTSSNAAGQDLHAIIQMLQSELRKSHTKLRKSRTVIADLRRQREEESTTEETPVRKRARRHESPVQERSDGSSHVEQAPEIDPAIFVDVPPPKTVNPLLRNAQRQSLQALRPTVVLDDLTLEDVDEIFNRPVGRKDGQDIDLTLNDKCNFSQEGVLKAFNHRGITSAACVEQGRKTDLAVALAGLCSAKSRPIIVIAGLPHANTCELSDKMRVTLEYFGIRTLFLSNAQKKWDRFTTDEDDVEDFRNGNLVVVMPAYAMARMSFVEQLDVQNALLVVDESDVLFGKEHWSLGSKEEVVGNMLKDILGHGSRVTGTVMISATHLGDFHTYNKHLREHVPMTDIHVDVDLLRDRGFTTHHEMTLINTVEMGDAVKEKQHGLTTPGFRHLIKDFKECPGTKKLMLVASCPRVNVGESTLRTQGDLLQRYDPEAVVIVHHSGKCLIKPEGAQDWITMKTVNPEGRTANERRANNVKTIGKALDLLQARHCRPNESVGRTEYVDRRFIVVGYHALARSTSPRTGDMVPTHMFALLGKGRHTADVRQTLMRPAGQNTDVRATNGHGNVKVVTIEKDWEMMQVLYEFQEEIQKEMDRNPNFNFESFGEFRIKYAPVIGSYRKHARPQLKFDDRWSVRATPEEKADYLRYRQQKREEREAQVPPDLPAVPGQDQEMSAVEEQQPTPNASAKTLEQAASSADEERRDADAGGVVPDDQELEYEDDYLDEDDEELFPEPARKKVMKASIPQHYRVLILLKNNGPTFTRDVTSMAARNGEDIKTGHGMVLWRLRQDALITPTGIEPIDVTLKGKALLRQLG